MFAVEILRQPFKQINFPESKLNALHKITSFDILNNNGFLPRPNPATESSLLRFENINISSYV
jgi:hypothetical protein